VIGFIHNTMGQISSKTLWYVKEYISQSVHLFPTDFFLFESFNFSDYLVTLKGLISSNETLMNVVITIMWIQLKFELAARFW
jgi:hypothetical protein